jgi:CRISPR-associated endonuclease/helicase Cas3
MLSEELNFFRTAYVAMDGRLPFPWQERLFVGFCDGHIPGNAVIPTGCGKTSTMLVWLLAVAWQARNGPHGLSLPRRLAWVVNRRVVVDQATAEAERLRRRLSEGKHGLSEVRQALGTLSTGQGLLGISTLRGQFADNAEWRDDPARPAIVVGTVDMIGSRLLFSGYGVGFKHRPLHGGFLGQDALIVHDEAHLEPAFQRLLEAVRDEQERCGEFRQFHVMALTATSRADERSFGLTEVDRVPGTEIRRRIDARKGLAFHRVETEKKVAEAIAERALAFGSSGGAILIFVRTLKDVEEVGRRLGTKGVQLLTGTIRGYERDRLAREDAVYARFAPDSTAERTNGTVYLICTSAGEVGANLSADHMVCDLSTFESMAQRLGRVNRFGSGDAQVEVVYGADMKQESDLDQRRLRTLEILQKLELRPDGRYDASPAGLESLPVAERIAAFAPEPEFLPASEILFDAWALTSIRPWQRLPGRPPVAEWLHGVEEWEPAQTAVAWREEVALVDGELETAYPPEDLLDDYPLKPHELLRDSSARILGQLKKLAAREPDTRVWLVDGDGNVRSEQVSKVVSREPEELRDYTIVLPPSAGGLTEGGMLEGAAGANEGVRYDIADDWLEGMGRQRSRTSGQAPQGMRLIRRINLARGDEETPDYWWWFVREAGSRIASFEQELATHTDSARRIACDLVARVALPEPEAAAVVCAAEWHDAGKRRARWQRSIGNFAYPDRILAKSGPEVQGVYCGYRHELGSLVNVFQLEQFHALEPEVQELVLHLVAAHHGRARPHFPEQEVFDPDFDADARQIAMDVPRRYARLQRKYGRWGLAYLESLVRAADGLASQNSVTASAAGVGA